MSDDKNTVTDKAGEIARNIWLAGVGAYGKAVEDAQGRLEKAMEPPKLFKDLVKAGTALEEDAREALGSTAAARQSVEERIARVRENFHMQRPARIEDLVALTKTVEQLSRKVDALTKALAEQGITAGTSATRAKKKKAAPTSQSASVSKKATKKKAPARKQPTVRRKTVAKKRQS